MDRNHVSISSKHGHVWAVFPATITMDNYLEIENAITGHLAGDKDRVVLDLAHTMHLYSSGIGLLIRIRRRVSESGGTVSLVNVNRKIREILAAVLLNKIFPIYPTDVEFELTHSDAWVSLASRPVDFVFVIAEEDGVCRINLTGQMTTGSDLSSFHDSIYKQGIKQYLFDLTGLELIDSYGIQLLLEVIVQIHKHDGKSAAYGPNSMIREMFELLSLTEHIFCYDNERDALAAIGKT